MARHQCDTSEQKILQHFSTYLSPDDGMLNTAIEGTYVCNNDIIFSNLHVPGITLHTAQHTPD